MKQEAFDELLASVRQAGNIRRGKLKPSRVTKFKPADVKAIRGKLGQSQVEFAGMIGVSIATLRNWEQGRRRPDGPALALLKVTAADPLLVATALHGTRKRNSSSGLGGKFISRGARVVAAKGNIVAPVAPDWEEGADI
jgi:putative transcriptional regulator